MILYFSGTGNSRYVARELSRLLGEKAPVSMVSADGISGLSAQERLVWVFPVYSWGVPPVVVEFMKRMPQLSGAKCWLVCTCGDDVGMAPEQWAALINNAGGTVCGMYSVEMPNTYVTFPWFDVDAPDVERDKLDAAPHRVSDIALDIAGGRSGIDVVRGAFPRFKSGVIYPWFIRHAMSPEPFRVTGECVGCGRCVRQCPMGNISLNASNRPEWGSRCAFCLACYHVCPAHAVRYGAFSKRKGQYLCPL